MTVSEFINKERIKLAENLLLTTDLNVETIAMQIGFSSQSYFSKTFKKINGVSPVQFKKNIK